MRMTLLLRMKHQRSCCNAMRTRKPQLAFTERRDSSKIPPSMEKMGTTTVGTCFQKPFSPVCRRGTNTCSLNEIADPLKEEYLVNKQLTHALVVGLKFEPYSDAEVERIKKEETKLEKAYEKKGERTKRFLEK